MAASRVTAIVMSRPTLRQVLPVEGCEAVARTHPVGDHDREYGTPAAGGDLQAVPLGDAQSRGVRGVNLHERAGVELGDLAGLGQCAPLVLQAARVEGERVVVVGEFGCGQLRAAEERRAPARGGESQSEAGAVLAFQEGLADAVVEVADRVAVRAVGGR
ncbi:hypothetical protein AQJ64_00790 [Streptomyces griseoruber]|uniref:Uncharacterized protein n=1 Tax=Streptomyces griseoruber TaxID=1943 RepID=A0A117RGA7_9ACTN|nr:hypothetical protein AQJ64_00790 [Streptomyces griseoruber]